MIDSKNNDQITVDKKSKVLFYIMAFLLLLTSVATFYKLVVLQEFAVVPSATEESETE